MYIVMLIIKSIIFTIMILLISYAAGVSVKIFVGDKLMSAAHTYITGVITLMLMFGVVQIPFRLCSIGIEVLAAVYCVTVMALLIAGIVKNGFKSYAYTFRKQLKLKLDSRQLRIAFAAVIMVMALQILFSVLINATRTYYNDAAISGAMQFISQGNARFGVDVLTGNEISVRVPDIFKSAQTFIAVMSVLVGENVLVTANLFIVLMTVPAMYAACYMFCAVICSRESRYYVAAAAGLLNMFSCYALRPKNSLGTLTMINAWNPDAVVCGIILPVVWYLSISTVKVMQKVRSSAASLCRKSSDRNYTNALNNRKILSIKLVYLMMCFMAACFISVFGTAVCVMTYLSVYIYYFVICGYAGRYYTKKYFRAFIPVGVFIGIYIIGGFATHSFNGVSDIWSGWLNNMVAIYKNNFSTNVYLVAFIAAALYQYIKGNSISVAVCVYIPVIVCLLCVINPIIYLLFALVEPPCNSMLHMAVPFNPVMAYTLVSMIITAKTNKTRVIYAVVFGIAIIGFLPRYGINFEWTRTRSLDKLPEQTVEVCRIIEESGLDKKVIAVDSGDLCYTLRLAAPDIDLYYYSDNFSCYGGDTSMYGYVNQDEPYMQGIIQAAKSAGYNYIVLKKGILDPNWASVLYHVWPEGSTEQYDVYSIGYF